MAGDKEKFQGSLMGRRTICEGLVSLLVAGATLAAPKTVHAQAKYPERPVRIIVPFGAGGVADITTRPSRVSFARRIDTFAPPHDGKTVLAPRAW